MRIKGFLICLVALSLTLAALPPRAQAIATIILQVCRDMTVQNLGSSGVRVNPTGCGREFPVSSPCVVLAITVERIEYRETFTWQLYAPTDEVYARGRTELDTEPGHITNWHITRVLPVAATEKEIVEKNPEFRFRVVEVGAKPISEMPGEWKLQASLGRGSPTVLRFTLKP